MNIDLRISICMVGLSALLSALGGLLLLIDHFQEDIRRENPRIEMMAEELSSQLVQDVASFTNQTLQAKTELLMARLEQFSGVGTVFVWRKGRGIIWVEGSVDETEGMGRDFTWKRGGGKSIGRKKGWFQRQHENRTQLVSWARTGSRDVCGFILDPATLKMKNNFPCYTLGLLCMAVVCGAGISGASFLHRCASLSRNEVSRMNEFTNLVSHELRTPLAGILPSIELLLEDGEFQGTPAGDRLKGVHRECSRMVRLISRLLTMCRLHRGMMRMDFEELDIAQLARTVVEALPVGNAQHAIMLSGEHRLMVRADSDAVHEILGILLDNARKYAGEECPLEINVGAEMDDTAFVQVLDRGPGIPSEIEACIFEKYQRGPGSEGKSAGLGIGLALARDLARGMGGDLTYRARAGGGAVFCLKLERSNGNG